MERGERKKGRETEKGTISYDPLVRGIKNAGGVDERKAVVYNKKPVPGNK